MEDKMKGKMVYAFKVQRRSRIAWMRWLQAEYIYADNKFDTVRESDHDPIMAEEGVGDGSWWENQVLQYVRRASTLGLDNPLGRQALCKGLAAYTGMVEAMIRLYGEPPEAGVPSGEIVAR